MANRETPSANISNSWITPFFTIWTEPRATIRRIVDTDPTRNVLTLAAIPPAIAALAGQWSRAMSSNANLSVLWPIWVAFTVVIEGALGILGLYIAGAVLRWSGSLLGGVASSIEVRAAIAWAGIPGITFQLVLLLAVLLGVPMPHPAGNFVQIDPAFYKVGAIEFVLGIWGFFVELKCLAEVHRFSAWRAFFAVLIVAVMFGAVLGVFGLILNRIVGHH